MCFFNIFYFCALSLNVPTAADVVIDIAFLDVMVTINVVYLLILFMFIICCWGNQTWAENIDDECKLLTKMIFYKLHDYRFLWEPSNHIATFPTHLHFHVKRHPKWISELRSIQASDPSDPTPTRCKFKQHFSIRFLVQKCFAQIL